MIFNIIKLISIINIDINNSKEKTLVNLYAVSQRLYQNKIPPRIFYLEFWKFFQNRRKEQLQVNSSENIK